MSSNRRRGKFRYKKNRRFHGNRKYIEEYDEAFYKVPVSICRLTRLRKLRLKQCKLKCVQPWIGRLRNLEQLNLSFNHLKYLPNQICHLSKLQRLNLCHNELNELPTNIGQLRSLNILYIDHNRLKTLPQSIADIDSIKGDYTIIIELILRAGDNPLEYIPAVFIELQKKIDFENYNLLSFQARDNDDEQQRQILIQPQSLLSIALVYVKENMVYI